MAAKSLAKEGMMVFWFSGTGNSYSLAKKIADSLGERLVSISLEMDQHPEGSVLNLAEGERLGFVYPVYAWAPPKMVLDFIDRLKAGNAAQKSQPYVYSLCTCGDEEGKTTDILRKHLMRKGFTLVSAFCLKMPNNYILGFDVDSKVVEDEKLQKAGTDLKEIIAMLLERQKDVFHLLPGSMPGVKSSVVNPLFNRFAMNVSKFRATEACNGCGICATVCQGRIITVRERPVWGKECTQCLACIHHCPKRAIEYGKATTAKGRYLHPDASGMRKAMAAKP